MLYRINRINPRPEAAAAAADSELLWAVIMDAHESGIAELARRLTAIAQQQQAEDSK